MANLKTCNPADGKIIDSYNIMTDNIVTDIINKLNNTHLLWKEFSFEKRAKYILNLANILENNIDKYAKIITIEMGKPITQSRQEISKCALLCKHYAQNAEKYLKDKLILTDYSKSYITYQPLGIVFGIMPWNFPFWQVFRFAIPTIMAGNTALLKHAPISLGAALAIEKLFLEAGCPENLFRSLVINDSQAENIIANKKISAVTLTGSIKAGSIVASLAGKNIKKIVLELGGSDPYIILNDADLDEAAEICVKSRLNNCGQVCIAAKRLIIEKDIYNKFKAKLLEKINKYNKNNYINPLDENCLIGPMAREDLRDILHKQVSDSIQKGAICLQGGELPKNTKGFFYPVTVLEEISENSPAYKDELFGPVFCLFKANDIDDAIEIANDTEYGLAAAIFTKDIELAQKVANTKLQAGVVAINDLVSSNPLLPFGGIKNSGFGRELSEEGIKEFVNVKTIVIK